MTGTVLRILALAIAALLYCVQARASTTSDAIELVCPGHAELAPFVEAAARRQLEHPVLLVALMAVESHCRADAVSRKGARGLLQIRGVAAAGLTVAERHDPAKNIEAGSRWLASLVVWCGSLPAGLGAYNSGSCTKSRRFARHVLAVAAKIWRELARRQDPRS
jgi:soluble lytic murein transglycosylase-like protein